MIFIGGYLSISCSILNIGYIHELRKIITRNNEGRFWTRKSIKVEIPCGKQFSIRKFG